MSRPAQIELLSRFAFAYEPTVRLIGFPALWQSVAEAAQPRRGEWGLDVCTGTGGAARELARRGVRVVGLDLAGFLTGRGLAVGSPRDLGPYRIWPCRVRR
jgi:ubiquinone/menaquinone biosynthesis C-methylase UbiE